MMSEPIAALAVVLVDAWAVELRLAKYAVAFRRI